MTQTMTFAAAAREPYRREAVHDVYRDTAHGVAREKSDTQTYGQLRTQLQSGYRVFCSNFPLLTGHFDGVSQLLQLDCCGTVVAY